MRRALSVSLVLLAGCSGVTEILVDVDTDLRVPAELESIRVEVEGPPPARTVWRREIQLDRDTAFPLRFPLHHGSGPLGPLVVTVSGLDGEDVVVQQVTTTQFVAGRSQILPVSLDAACADARCAGDERCEAGRCVPLAMDDAGPFDAGPRDAGPAAPICPAGCSCEQICADGCTCEDACGCELTCVPGDDCRVAKCEDDSTCTIDGHDTSNLEVDCKRGATCTVDARGASNVSGKCHDGSRCTFDCAGTSNCEVECRNGATCALDCGGDFDNCGFTGCGDLDEEIDEAEGRLHVRCPDGRVVCGGRC